MGNADRRDGITTASLCENLYRFDSPESFFQRYENELNPPPFHEFIKMLCNRRGEIPQRVISRANIESSYGHQIFKGARSPSRDTVIQLAFGLEADVKLTQELLRLAEKAPLYVRVKRDAAIMHCINHCVPIVKAQLMLSELKLPLLGEGGKK